MTELGRLPDELPVPEDDGACDHLLHKNLPSVELASTDGNIIDLSRYPGWLVIYCYPMTGRPDRELPDKWDSIPGARGCTPQTCSFRDHYLELAGLNAAVYGLSTQTTEYQLEAKQRLQLPFDLLSDHLLEFASALNLPVFAVDNIKLIKRVTLITESGNIKKIFYPVFPPAINPTQVINWLKAHKNNHAGHL